MRLKAYLHQSSNLTPWAFPSWLSISAADRPKPRTFLAIDSGLVVARPSSDLQPRHYAVNPTT